MRYSVLATPESPSEAERLMEGAAANHPSLSGRDVSRADVTGDVLSILTVSSRGVSLFARPLDGDVR